MILAIVLISQASAYSEYDVMEQNLGYGVGPPTKQGNLGHHHVMKREPATLTTLTTILTTVGPIVAIVLIVVFVSLLALYLFVFLIVLAVGGTGAVSGSALFAFFAGKRRRRREADSHPLSSWLAATEPETFASIIDSIR